MSEDNATILDDPAKPMVVYALSGLLLINSLLSVLGNLLIIYTFLVEKPLGRPLRIILSHLAVSNLVIASIGEPMVVISGFNLQWVFGEMGRKMEAYVVTACGLMAMSCLAFVSIERYLRVTGRKRLRVTDTVSVRACTLMWLYNLVYASVPFYGIAGWKGEGIGISNSLEWQTNRTLDIVYVVMMMVTGYFLPLIIISFCYNRILFFVKQAVDVYEEEPENRVSRKDKADGPSFETQMTKVQTTTGESSTSAGNREESKITPNSLRVDAGRSSTVEFKSGQSGDNLVSSDDGRSREPEQSSDNKNDPVMRIKAAERKISNVIAIIIVSFFVSWTPYTIVNLLVTFDKAHMFSKGIHATIPALLAKTSTLWSPIIYCVMNGEVRTANLKTLAKLKRRLRILYFGGRAT